ncbi:MAG TPA: helix-turn-helix domain-containing protein [Longimicrobium sp.]
MRTYHQYCALARALDVVGDRWTLLIVRELMTLGPARYTDIRNGLPGIASNLLVDRLRELEEARILERTDAPPPVATALFRLTPRGEALRPVIHALGTWAGPTLGAWEAGDEFRSHWLVLPLEIHLAGRAPGRDLSIEVRTGDEPLAIESAGGETRVRRGPASSPDAVVSGPPDLVLAALLGRVALDAARERGLRVEGDAGAVEAVRAAVGAARA